MNRLLSNKRTIFLLVAPGCLFFLGVIMIPIGLSVFYSFTNFDGVSTLQFVGLQNYVQIFTNDPVFGVL